MQLIKLSKICQKKFTMNLQLHFLSNAVNGDDDTRWSALKKLFQVMMTNFKETTIIPKEKTRKSWEYLKILGKTNHII